MRRLLDAGRAVRRDDDGFTLVELLVTIVLLGVVVAPLSAVLIFHLKTSDRTAARMSESHDAQLATSYFAQDVRSVGVRGDYSSTAEPPLVQSVETAVAAGGGLYPCGAAGTPDAVVRLAWDDYDDAAVSSRTQQRVAYVVAGAELHRLTCDGTGALVSDLTLAHDLVAPGAVVTCADATGAATSCTGPAVPDTVSLVLTIRNPDSASDPGDPYEVTLTGQRRQS